MNDIQAVVAAFGKEYAKTGILHPTHHQHLFAAFEMRQIGDCIIDREIPVEKAAEIIRWANEFLIAAEKLIQRENPD